MAVPHCLHCCYSVHLIHVRLVGRWKLLNRPFLHVYSPSQNFSFCNDWIFGRNKGRTMDARIEFNVGWDFAAYGLPLPDGANARVREGFAAGQAKFRRPIGDADRYVRKWLQLRHNASKRGRLFNDDVTPDWLRLIDVEVCPITLEPLTHSTLSDTDWSVDRIVNDGSYSMPNIAVMSTRANKAKGNKTIDEISRLSEAGETVDGLTGAEWYRLAGFVFGSYVYAGMAAPMAGVYPYSPYIPDHVCTTWAQTVQRILMNKYLEGHDSGGRFPAIEFALSCERGKALLHNLKRQMRRATPYPKKIPIVMLDPLVFDCYLKLHEYFMHKVSNPPPHMRFVTECPEWDEYATDFQKEISFATRGYGA